MKANENHTIKPIIVGDKKKRKQGTENNMYTRLNENV